MCSCIENTGEDGDDSGDGGGGDDDEPYDCDEKLICPKAKGEHVQDEVHSRAVEGSNLMNIFSESQNLISCHNNWSTEKFHHGQWHP